MTNMIDIAIRQLSEYQTSERELRTFLEKKFAALPKVNASIDSVFKRLHELNLLNDLRLATNLAQHYTHKGNRFIYQILQQKGIKEEIITHALMSLEPEKDRALKEARKKLGIQWDNSEKTMNLLHRFLSGRSFSFKTITKVTSQFGRQQRSY